LYDTLFGSASGTANAAAAFIWENGIERIKEYPTKPIIGSVETFLTEFYLFLLFLIILCCFPISLCQVHFCH